MPVSAPANTRDHGGGLDAARQRFGGARSDWLDLSTGINPVPYPIGDIPAEAWTALPDKGAQEALTEAARSFWNVPDDATILATHGASAPIAAIPALMPAGRVDIPTPTYNEHAAAFMAQGWELTRETPDTRVLVSPNNPTGKLWTENDLTAPLTVIDESFCDVTPDASLIHTAPQKGRIILKSFGKFWGLAGLRLGFAIAAPDLIARLNDLTGPWAVSGPALNIGTQALSDTAWAEATRARLAADTARLDTLMISKGATLVGGTTLFRLYEVDNAATWQHRLAQNHVWSRIFPYSKTFLRLGLPAPNRWDQLEAAL